jgi:four helix bundle protein
MAGVERFEELLAWQKARELTRAVYAISRQGQFARDLGLADQIQRAAVSVMSNIAEGFERNSPAEFHQFLSIAKSSCGEARSLLYVAFDADYLNEPTFDRVRAQSDEISRVVGGLRASVERRRDLQRSIKHRT